MFFTDDYPLENDEIYLEARELIATRSKYVQYSPTQDIFKLRGIIFNYTENVEAVAVTAFMISALASSAEITGANYIVKALKYPVVYNQIISMLKDIDNVILGANNNYSCNISKALILDLFRIFRDYSLDCFSDTWGNIVSGKWFSSQKQTTKHVISNWGYGMLGLSIASYTICIGWLYMCHLKGKIIEQGMLFNQDNNIAKLLVEELKSNKEGVKRVNKYACDIIRTPCPADELRTVDEIEKILKSSIETKQKEDQMAFNLEKDEQHKLANNKFLSSSFEGVVITDQIASITTHCLLYNKSIFDSVLLFMNDHRTLQAFQSDWSAMINRGIAGMSGYSSGSLDNIKSNYCNYLSDESSWPCYLQSDWQHSTLLLYPNIQGADSLVQTLHIIFDINQRIPSYIKAGKMFLLWSFMFAEMNKEENGKISQIETETFFPYLICVLIRLYAPIRFVASDCFYNTKNIPRIFNLCKNAMPHFAEILDYLPPYFQVLKVSNGDEAKWVLSVNNMMMRYVGDRIYGLLNGSINLKEAIKELDVIKLSDIFIYNFKPLYKRIY